MKSNILVRIKSIALLLIVSFTLNSCLLDDDVTDFGEGPIVVQFENTKATGIFLQTDDNEVYDYEIPMVIFGGDGKAIDRDVEITISGSSESTATEGVEYQFSSGKSFTLPAGETEVMASIQVHSETLDAMDPVTLVLQIDSSSETVSDNNKTVITLQAICPSDLSGNYVYTTGSEKSVTITETGSGTYRVSGDDYFASAYYIDITDVCNELTITDGGITSFGIDIGGTGSVDPETGNITLIYTVDGYFTDRVMIMERQ